MKPRIHVILRMGLVVAVMVPILISFIFPRAVSAVDYIIQGALIISAIVFSFLRIGLGSAFGMPFLLGIVWGFWRIAYFDPLTENDIPGIGYVIVAFQLGIIGMVIYGIRKAVLKYFPKSPSEKAQQGAAANP